MTTEKMSLEEWKQKANALEAKVKEAEAVYDEAREERDLFLESTVGFSPGSPATLLGTIDMFCKIMDMRGHK